MESFYGFISLFTFFYTSSCCSVIFEMSEPELYDFQVLGPQMYKNLQCE